MKATNKGRIYVLANESMPGILKVGYTMRDAATRAWELYIGKDGTGTGVPGPFDVIREWEVDVDAYELEQELHAAIDHIIKT